MHGDRRGARRLEATRTTCACAAGYFVAVGSRKTAAGIGYRWLQLQMLVLQASLWACGTRAGTVLSVSPAMQAVMKKQEVAVNRCAITRVADSPLTHELPCSVGVDCRASRPLET